MKMGVGTASSVGQAGTRLSVTVLVMAARFALYAARGDNHVLCIVKNK